MAIGAGIAGAIGVVSKGIGAAGDIKAGKKQDAAAKEQEIRDRAAVDESVRRQGLADKQIQAEGRARAAASGTGGGGSIENFLDVQKGEQGRQLDWMRTAGYQEAAERRRGGELDAAGSRNRGIAGGVGAIGGAFGRLGGR